MSTGFLKYHTGIFETIWEPWSVDFQSQQKISKQHENYDHLIFKAYKDFEKYMRTMSTVLSKYHAMIFKTAWEAWSHDIHGILINNLKSVWDLWTLNLHRIQELSKLHENHDHLISMGYQDF